MSDAAGDPISSRDDLLNVFDAVHEGGVGCGYILNTEDEATSYRVVLEDAHGNVAEGELIFPRRMSDPELESSIRNALRERFGH